jgi:hypothetical protein
MDELFVIARRMNRLGYQRNVFCHDADEGSIRHLATRL